MLEILSFKAPWCGPCRAISPMIEEVKKEMASQAKISVFDVDLPANNSLVEKYQVTSVPTIVFLKNGEVVDKIKGALTKTAFVRKIQSLV